MTGISGWQVGCGSNQSVAGKPGGRESHVLRCRAGGKKPKDGLREHPPPPLPHWAAGRKGASREGGSAFSLFPSPKYSDYFHYHSLLFKTWKL